MRIFLNSNWEIFRENKMNRLIAESITQVDSLSLNPFILFKSNLTSFDIGQQ